MRENLAKRKLIRDRLRVEILAAYGAACVCCGEGMAEFLTIDHINGGGRKHRRDTKMTGTSFYYWLRRNGFPLDFQILCMNCNFAKWAYGCCPHNKEK